MRKLQMFNMVTLDGFFEGPGNDITWHSVDKEFNDFAIEQLDAVDTIIFGRKTYELMVSYWPTAEAIKDDPMIASIMNSKQKIVCSRTLPRADWTNTQLAKDDVEGVIRRLKTEPGKDLIIFGSAILCAALTRAGLIDEYRLMVSPIVLSAGTPLFRDKQVLKLIASRRFGNGNVLLTYAPKGG